MFEESNQEIEHLKVILSKLSIDWSVQFRPQCKQPRITKRNTGEPAAMDNSISKPTFHGRFYNYGLQAYRAVW